MSSCGDSPVEEEPSPHHIVPQSNPLISLRHSLETEGCPYSLDLSDEDSCQVDVMNWLLTRINQQRCGISSRDDALSTLRGELNYSENRIDIMARDKERVLTQSSRFQEQERKCSQINQNLTARYKQACDELARHKSQSAHLQTQFVHESRKKERETQRLKERLEQILSDKSKDDKRSLEVLNALKKSRGESGRAKWRTEGKEELEMYQSIIRQYEDKQRDLVTLVDSLRQALFDTDTELSQILSLSPCQPTRATSTLGSEDEWGPVLKVKFEALRERVKGLAGSGEDPQVVLDHSFSADDSVLNSINANI